MAIWEQPGILSGTSQPNIGGNIKPELAICILHTGTVTTQWAIRTAHVFMHLQNMKMPFSYLLNRNQPYDTGREQITRAGVGAGAKWIFHYDSDTLIPINAIEVLIQWAEKFDLPVLSGLYWAKKPGTPMPAAWIKIGEHPEQNKLDFAPVDIKPHLQKQTIVPVDVTGAGCLLIRADIFKKLDESNPDLPYFQWGLGRKLHCPKCKHTENLPMMSEDFYFCTRVQNELGIKPHLATAVRCDHICTVTRRGDDGEFELQVNI